jgi:hypothetical protein
MARKRYTSPAAANLLARLLATQVSTARARRLLAELLDAPLGDVAIAATTSGAVRAASDVDIATWMQTVRAWLTKAVRLSALGSGMSFVLTQVRLTVSASSDVRAEVDGPPGKMLLIQSAALARLGRKHLRHCACGQFFAGAGKRRVCSDRCQKRYYMQRYRAGDAGKG